MRRLRSHGHESVAAFVVTALLALLAIEVTHSHRARIPAILLDDGKMDFVSACLIPVLVGASLHCYWFSEGALGVCRWVAPWRAGRAVFASVAAFGALIALWGLTLHHLVDDVAFVALRNAGLAALIGSLFTAAGFARLAPLGSLLVLLPAILPGSSDLRDVVGLPTSPAEPARDIAIAGASLVLSATFVLLGTSRRIATPLSRLRS